VTRLLFSSAFFLRSAAFLNSIAAFFSASCLVFCAAYFLAASLRLTDSTSELRLRSMMSEKAAGPDMSKNEMPHLRVSPSFKLRSGIPVVKRRKALTESSLPLI